MKAHHIYIYMLMAVQMLCVSETTSNENSCILTSLNCKRTVCPQVPGPLRLPTFSRLGQEQRWAGFYLSCEEEIERLTAQAKGSCPRTVTAAVKALCSLKSPRYGRPMCLFLLFAFDSFLFLWHPSRWHRTWPNVHADLARSLDRHRDCPDSNDGETRHGGCQIAT